MNIYVNGRQAVLKDNFSFDYVAENRLFSGRDGYTLNITFPMVDCPENRTIFGNIHRADVAKSRIAFPCDIVHRNVRLSGSLSVTKTSATEVEGQFTEGRCEQTASDPFEDISIVELDLGSYPQTDPSKISPDQAWLDISYLNEAVALPWVNEKYPDAPNNWAHYSDVFQIYVWDQNVKALSWQPYLIVIAERILDAVGYTYDFKEWWQSDKRFLLICNTLPASWEIYDFAKALPDWTVTEFFERLELLLMAEFDFDHRAKSCTMRFSKDVVDAAGSVAIDNVIDSYEAELSKDDDNSCDYIVTKRLAYKEASHSMQKFYACDWFMQKYERVRRYDTLAELIEKNRRRIVDGNPIRIYWGEEIEARNTSTVPYLLYAADVDTYFIFYSIGTEEYVPGRWTQKYILVPVNVFGSGVPDSDDVDTEEIDFVPVCIMDTYVSDEDDMGTMMFLSLDDNDDDYSMGGTRDGAPGKSEIAQPTPALYLEKGEQEAVTAFYDTIYVAYWDGHILEEGKQPCPYVDPIIVSRDWKDIHFNGPTLRIAATPSHPESALCYGLPKIDKTQKVKFSWLSSTIPNPRAIFNIRGRRYVCEKITATFTPNGMSELLKGEFYPLLDD